MISNLVLRDYIELTTLEAIGGCGLRSTPKLGFVASTQLDAALTDQRVLGAASIGKPTELMSGLESLEAGLEAWYAIASTQVRYNIYIYICMYI